MSSVLRPFVDQENASQVRIRGSVGKAFQSANPSFSSTPARRALGDLNTGGKPSISLDQKAASALRAQLKPALPASKPMKSKTEEKTRLAPKKSQVKSGNVGTEKVRSRLDEDKEIMILPQEEQDDFEDLWPVSERPTTYLAGAKAWRSTNCFVVYQESDSDDSLVVLSDNDDDDTGNPTHVKNPYIETPLDIQEEVLQTLEEIDMPSLEELDLCIETPLDIQEEILQSLEEINMPSLKELVLL